MRETAERVKEGGVPVLARPREEGGYEWIASRRRKHAWELAGLTAMPVIARSIARDAAAVIMADGSLQRESILPSQRQGLQDEAGGHRFRAGAPFRPRLGVAL